jgi:DNA polymerase (family 10)
MDRSPPAPGIVHLTSSRLSLGRAHLLASTVIRDARRAGFPIRSLTPLGSLRRYSPDVGDVSLLAVAPPDRYSNLLNVFTRLPFVMRAVSVAPSAATVLTERGTVTLRLAAPEDAGASLVWHTGSRRHTTRLQERARGRGMTLQDGQLLNPSNERIATPTEDDLYRHLGLPYIAPELREGADEIEAAARGELPQLVSDLHIRGDLHMHSTWSDGRNTIEEMALAAIQLGYQYVAITDHSENAWSSRKLARADVPRQRDEIEAVRAGVRNLDILWGIEVDIMQDGSLDFDDETLAGFDIVLASLHDHGGQNGRRLTERYLRAIHHPLVSVITHPANRSPALTPGYDVDFDALFAAAAETGTAMEIDGSPGHLDMDGLVARRAVAAGVTVVIDSDCHRADALGRQMRFGLGTARRGWIEPRHVLNTRRVDAVRDFVAKKRER